MVIPNKVLSLSCTLADIERKAIYLPISFTNIQGILLDYPRHPSQQFPRDRLCFVVLIE